MGRGPIAQVTDDASAYEYIRNKCSDDAYAVAYLLTYYNLCRTEDGMDVLPALRKAEASLNHELSKWSDNERGTNTNSTG